MIEWIPGLSAGNIGLTAVLAVACAVMSIIFCVVMHKTAHIMQRLIKNPYLRVMAGGALIIVLTLIFGRDYNGAGGNIIEEAISGNAVPYAFIVKLVFTAVTLGAGFKGGEIVPSFFVGATLGCVLGPLMGLPASFSAAMCLVGVLCGVVNCPNASGDIGGRASALVPCRILALCAGVIFPQAGSTVLFQPEAELRQVRAQVYNPTPTDDLKVTNCKKVSVFSAFALFKHGNFIKMVTAMY